MNHIKLRGECIAVSFIKVQVILLVPFDVEPPGGPFHTFKVNGGHIPAAARVITKQTVKDALSIGIGIGSGSVVEEPSQTGPG